MLDAPLRQDAHPPNLKQLHDSCQGTFTATALIFADVWQGGKGRHLCLLGLGMARAAVEQMQYSLLDALGLVKGTQRLNPGKQHMWHACRVLPSMCLWHKLLALVIHCLYTGITISASPSSKSSVCKMMCRFRRAWCKSIEGADCMHGSERNVQCQP